MNLEYLFVDRISENNVICESSSGEEVIFSVQNVAGKVKEGDVVYIDHNGHVTVDYDATCARKKEILALRENLKSNGNT